MNAAELALHQEEKRSAYKSLIITGVICSGILVLGLMWTAMKVQNPPVFELTYIELYDGTGGGGQMMDFGNNVEGSGDVNNFFDPSPTPADAPPSHVASNSPSVSGSDPVLTDPNGGSGVSAPPSNPNNNNHSHVLDESASFDGGGSNHGNNNGTVGNAGNPNSQNLDPEGNFEGNNLGHGHGNGIGDGTGDGIDGNYGGRKLLNLVRPSYTADQDAKIKFDFTIDSQGHVIYVKQPDTPHLRLAQAGMAAIKKWTFAPLSEEFEGKTTPGTVTITFFRK